MHRILSLAAAVAMAVFAPGLFAQEAGFEVIDVGGDPVAGWDVEDGRLVVTPLTAVTGSLSLEIELAAGAAEEILSPALVPEGATATLAAVKVGLSGDGLLELADAGTGQPVDDRQLAELPAGFREAPGRALVLAAGPPPRWRVTWPDRTEVLAAQIDGLVVDVLAGADGRAFYQLWAEVRLVDDFTGGCGITGTVTLDDDGGLLPGVTVSLWPSIGDELLAVSDQYGRFWFRGIAPDTYRLHAALEGLNSVEMTVAVPPGKTAELDLTLTLAAEGILVTSELPSSAFRDTDRARR